MLRINDFSLFADGNQLFSVTEMHLEKSKMAVIFGNNDSGKSLLLKTIHGDYFDFKGDIYIKENPAFFYRRGRRSRTVNPNTPWTAWR
jgi:ABC-type hemin transport system ATPase subunit